ncbi:type I restriction endonuclease subunit R [Neolewinella antarctica]|uniref:Type I restriction enzyme endonuclease subunit n=1 Tax=Neolewinella antarctica TaxID=442734 RepID=A0ABX0XFS7_9BACT|nr:HsdR family type I site-specific deoxyribonuclease [Neolewinella antarctica]NJC28179.1 type I restriction enzyme R subunit [Neolewinella antarctica]
MPNPSFQEDHISQIPALQLLINLGYVYLNPAEALALRGNKEANALLQTVLLDQLEALNSIHYKGATHRFSPQNLASCGRALTEIPLNEGLITANEKAYDYLTLGMSREQTIGGDKKSYNVRFIDWERPENNVFHVTEELAVTRTGSKSTYRPDLVLYVNGIPLGIIECKRPDMKDPLEQAISQHLRNQQEDGIRPLYLYSQLLLVTATNHAKYATTGTTGTTAEFWSQWREADPDDGAIARHVNTLLPDDVLNRMFTDRTRADYQRFAKPKPRLVTEQDRYLHNLCRPARLLDLTRNFTLFDAGDKKIARYQQFFAIKKTLARLTSNAYNTSSDDSYNASSNTSNDGNRISHIETRISHIEPRRGGVIWHTQGSGKSLTMVMLATAITEHPAIRNPKIVIVTDRVSLDDQIAKTFKKCGATVHQADNGKQLVEYLTSKSDAIITTVINKFESAVKRLDPLLSSEIFVLVDEGHRTQYGTFGVAMERAFPNACFLAFTGTPLSKKEKNTAKKFGGLIDSYTVRQAVADGAVVPLLYEGRLPVMEVNERPIEAQFEQITADMTGQQISDFKRKYARADQIHKSAQRIEQVAQDLTKHYVGEWRGTGFKGQLVTPDKLTAVKYKRALDEIPGGVHSELMISAPDMREGEDSIHAESDDLIKRFWKRMMSEHGGGKKYQENLVERFKKQERPEIMIVVDKLLTGFDAPNNRVLYIARSLREHTLLQAIARVNRVAPGKEYGLVIDYYGVLTELYDALEQFGDGFDPEDLEGTVTPVSEELEKLPAAHGALWDFFRGITNRDDLQEYQRILADEALRDQFYEALSAYARLLKLGLGTLTWQEKVGAARLEKYKADLKFMLRLRDAVRNIYSDTVDFKDYEKQIQKLLDRHVTSYEVETITDLVNIFETEAFEAEVEKVVGTAAKADLIASRTTKHCTERLEEDPTFYKRFSELLREVIADYRARRISELEYLARVKELKDQVLSRAGAGVPDRLRDRPEAQAFYGLCQESFAGRLADAAAAREVCADAGARVDDLIRRHVFDFGQPKVDWMSRSSITGPLAIQLEDYLIDEIKRGQGIELSLTEIAALTERFLEVAKIRYAA